MKRLLFLLLAALSLASCSLYMDGDEANGSGSDDRDSLATGDGFTAPRTEVTDEGTCTVQFRDGVHVYDDHNSRYVVAVDDSVVYFSLSTPYEHLPQVGEVIYSGFTQTFPEGYMAEVALVTRENGLYKCLCRRTSLDRVYREYKAKYSIDAGRYVRTAGDPLYQVAKRHAAPATRAVDHVSNRVFYVNFDTADMDWLPTESTGKWYQKSGDFKGTARLEMTTYIKLDYEIDMSDQEVYCLVTDSTVLTVEFSGTGSLKLDVTLVASDDALVKIRNLQIPLGTTPFKIEVAPSLTASFSASVTGKASMSKTVVNKNGFRKDETGTFRLSERPTYDWRVGYSKEVSAELKVEPKFAVDFSLGDKFNTVMLGVTPYVSIPITFSFVMNHDDTGFYFSQTPMLKAGLEIGVDLLAKVAFLDNTIWSWTPKMTQTYFPWLTLNLMPSLSNLTVTPQGEMSGSPTTTYVATFGISDISWAPDLSPILEIYDEDDMLVQQITVFKERANGKTHKTYSTQVTVPTDRNVSYYAKVSYTHNGLLFKFDERMDFGTSVRLTMPQVLQSVGMLDYQKRRTPHYFEVAGMMVLTGSSHVSKWGLHCYLYNDKGKVVLDKRLTFESRDGFKNFRVKFWSKNPGPYKLALVPCYVTGFVVTDAFTDLEQYAKTISLDPYFDDEGSDSTPGIDLVLK